MDGIEGSRINEMNTATIGKLAERPLGQVSTQLDQQEKLLSVLAEKISVLTDRLTTVLLDRGTDREPSREDGETREHMVHLAERVDSHNARVIRALNAVDALIDGVQL